MICNQTLQRLTLNCFAWTDEMEWRPRWKPRAVQARVQHDEQRGGRAEASYA